MLDTCAIGLCLLPNSIELALVTPFGEMINGRSLPILPNEGEIDAFILGRLVKEMQLEAETNQYRIAGLGIGLSQNETLQCSSLYKTSQVSLVEQLRQQTQLPVMVESLINLRAIAERDCGAGQGYQHILFIHIGQTIQSTYLVNGAIKQGVYGNMNALGELVADWLGEKPQTLSQRAGEGGIISQYMMRSRKYDKPSVQDICNFAKDKDQLAMRVLRDGGRVFAVVIRPVIAMLNPEVVIVSGTLAHSPLWFGAFERAIEESTLLEQLDRLVLKEADIPIQSHLIGAGLAGLRLAKA